MDDDEQHPRTGRPTRYSARLARDVCERLAAGESLHAICACVDMPAESTVRQWVVDDRDGFATRFLRARQVQAWQLADDLLDIADAEVPTNSETGCADSAAVQQLRLRVETRKWIIGRMLPRVFGDKLGVDHAGNVALQVVTNVPGPKP